MATRCCGGSELLKQVDGLTNNGSSYLSYWRIITMNHSTTPSLSYRSYRFSPRPALAALGIRMQGLNLFGPVRDHVHIAQKTVIHSPVQKWYDAFIALLAGAHGLVEINKRLRSDPSLQAAFGRQSCAEQSVVQETLDACTEAHVTQMHQARDAIYRRQSQGYRGT